MKEKVVCYRHTREVREHGYTELATVIHQEFVLVKKWGCLVLSKKQLLKERVPTFVQLQVSCLGYTDWQSAAPEWMIKEANANDWRQCT